jgi:2'-5' RNA ligase
MPDPIYTKSVTSNDLALVKDKGVIRIIVPFMSGWNDVNRLQMPPLPPPYWSNSRDAVLRATIHHEAMWAAAIGISLSKMASKGWEVKSDIPARANKGREILLEADGARVGWCGFILKNGRDYLCTDNGSFIEIVRETSKMGSKIVGLRHLDSLRCTRTGDPDIPVIYRDRMGVYHELRDYQTIMLSDMPDPGDTYYGTGLCAASRAYKAIFKLAAMDWYMSEKISGLRPLEIHIVNGLISSQIEGAVNAAKEESLSKGVGAYMGAVIVGTPSETPPSVVSIPLAGLPDRFDRKEEFDIAILTYADAIGLDPQELQPLSGQGLGTGTQTKVLDDKTKGKGLALWQQDFSHSLNYFVFDDKTEFMFVEKDYRDIEAQASAQQAHAAVSSARITAQITSPAQELQILVDHGDLPKEFLPNDITPGDKVTDDEKPDTEQQQGSPENAQQTSQAQPVATQQQTAGQIAAQQAAQASKPAPVDIKGNIAKLLASRQAKKEYEETVVIGLDCEDNEFIKAQQDKFAHEYGGERVEPKHVTLYFMGNLNDLDKADVIARAKSVASNFSRLDGEYNGFAAFAPEGGNIPIVALLDSPELPQLRETIDDTFCDIAPEQNHGFTAHTTLVYTADGNKTIDLRPADPSPVTFDSLVLYWGKEKIIFPFGRTKERLKNEPGRHNQESHGNRGIVVPRKNDKPEKQHINPYEAIAMRQDSAVREFRDSIKEQFGFDDAQATKIFNVYLKEKAIKYNNGSGRYLLSHGGFWEKEVMQRALEMADKPAKKERMKHLPGQHDQLLHGDRDVLGPKEVFIGSWTPEGKRMAAADAEFKKSEVLRKQTTMNHGEGTGPTSKFGPVDQFMENIKDKGWGKDGITWSGSETEGYKMIGRINKVLEYRVTIPAAVIKKGNYPLITGVKTGVYREGKPIVEWEGIRPIWFLAASKVGRGTGEIKWDPSERYGEYKYKFVDKAEKERIKHLQGQHDQQLHGIWSYPHQEISSAKTSINATKLPAAMSKINWKSGTVNADIGGGRFDNATEYLQGKGIENVIFDPFNRDKAHNDAAINKIKDGGANTATVNNVLNVIKEPEARMGVIRQAANAVGNKGTAYFSVYEGDRSGRSKPSTSGWQENRKLSTYADEIRAVFSDVVIKNGIIEAKNSAAEKGRKWKEMPASLAEAWNILWGK